MTETSAQFVRDRYSIEQFIEIAEDWPDRCLELINEQIVVHPIPEKPHQRLSLRLSRLLCRYVREIESAGCRIGLGHCYFELGDNYLIGESDICPDASIVYANYLDTNRRPPALLVIEILSLLNQAQIDRDTIIKPEIYATLAISAYWIVDRRDNCVWVHTQPTDGSYRLRQQFKGDAVLPAPGLEFLQITPAQIFKD